MNKKMIGAILGTLTFAAANIARAEDAKPSGGAKVDKAAKAGSKKAEPKAPKKAEGKERGAATGCG